MIQFATIIEPTAEPLRPEGKPMTDAPTIWGLTPTQIHDRYWATHGIQIIRQGEQTTIIGSAKLFLLTAPRTLLLFDPPKLIRGEHALLCLRLHDQRDNVYFERMECDAEGNLIGFRRQYNGGDALLARAFLTRSSELASLWQQAESMREAHRKLKSAAPRRSRRVQSITASVYDRADAAQVVQFMHRLVAEWNRPDLTIHRPRRYVPGQQNFLTPSPATAAFGSEAQARRGEGWGEGLKKIKSVLQSESISSALTVAKGAPTSHAIWADRDLTIGRSVRFIGPAWIGVGRKLEVETVVIGPAILWDDPHSPAQPIESVRWETIQPTGKTAAPIRPRRRPSLSRAIKRGFDFAIALVGIAITVPFYPLVILAIWLEDGRPFFFAHRREGRFGREFPCLKFRSMRKEADDSQGHLTQVNQADGPHFYVEYDPRLTRIGRLLRKTNIDELPQLFNVLLGHMSLVGPRPSPYEENQFCPAWREARLSVRPGLTGLWQVRRTRQSGLDFQEWIKFDIEYVESAGWKLDLAILWQTVWKVVRMEG